ncbi:hypothetical protein BST95_05940 [Halioglobus japonicus]|uniref:Polyhydroxybutyrate depolymerase n=1 Tax=Halioglobus japonicus TaxID=930805 RepID=A0AAP8ME36_9GAMM|nr:PHB depolymerase family esterase [Halioglobus japonicus]AQA17845.1 hypothetical protein BST95_05940 [Halioglobus japonicus]PLW85804.1 polyhydroxybutyrate depolymerase [Halioglobus japonicus]GHD17589.1 hypothetical protein GCM10007052_24240 [Halioglobus japonicus]
MKLFLKWLALGLVLVIAGLALTASWYLRWDEIEPPPLPGEVVAGAIDHSGLQRQWQAFVPETAGANAPLVIVLHGSLSDGNVARASTFYSFDVVAAREGFVVAYPDGIDQHWNDCRANASYAANQLNIDDVGFVRALVSELAERLGIDRNRVFVAGFSNGGQMAYRLAMEAPDLIAAAAPMVANMPAPGNNACEMADVAVPMLIVNGTADSINPYEGGVVNLFGDTSRGEVLSAEASARYWADLAGYTTEGERETLPVTQQDDATRLERLAWESSNRPSVALIGMQGAGHQFPHPVFTGMRALGPTSHQADGAELIWNFFSNTLGSGL